jgi:thioredoxin 1
MATKITSKEEFENHISGEKPVVIDFFATWCGPCKMMTPVFDAVSQTRTDVEMLKIDVDSLVEIAEKYGVMSIPTLVVVKGGKEVARSMGFKPKADLEKFIDSSLSK